MTRFRECMKSRKSELRLQSIVWVGSVYTSSRVKIIHAVFLFVVQTVRLVLKVSPTMMHNTVYSCIQHQSRFAESLCSTYPVPTTSTVRQVVLRTSFVTLTHDTHEARRNWDFCVAWKVQRTDHHLLRNWLDASTLWRQYRTTNFSLL
jgi:hypothetical protein